MATFPLPVLTGIGHSTNLSVTDMVAHTYNITPTDVAFALIGYFQTFDEKVQGCQSRIVEVSRRLLVDEQAKILRMTESVRMMPVVRLTEQQGRVGVMEEKVRLLHPDNILKRGFSITRLNGKVVTCAKDLKPGDELCTQVYEGEVMSVVR